MSIPLMYREEFSMPCIISEDDMAETITVTRTQRIYHQYDKFVSYFCHLSKNLWNQAHHIIYRYYKKYGRIPSYEELDGVLNKKSYYKKDGNVYPDFDNYHKLGGTTAQQILRVYMKEWKSFLKGIADYWKNKKNDGDKDYTGMPREPGYKEKDGEFILIFTNKQIKFTESKKDGSVWMTFQKTIDKQPSKLKDLKILLGNTNDLDQYLLKRLMFGNFNQVRIVPQGIGYMIEIVYDQEVLNNASDIYRLNKNVIMSIDAGVENLITITDNIGSQPIIIKSEICIEQLKLLKLKINGTIREVQN
jgi:transposase